MSDEAAALTDQVRARVAALGFELADLRRSGSARRVRLQVRIDRPGSTPGHGVTIEDCARVSRVLEQWLDASGVLGADYVLEVSSPGIERPIRWREHWERFVGHEVHVRLAGRGRCRALIVRVLSDQDAVVLRPSGSDQELTVLMAEAKDATLAVDWSAYEG